MKLFHLYALASLCIAHSVCAETVLAAAVANDHATSQAQQISTQTPQNTKETPVTDALVNLRIPLHQGYNYPAPGLRMEVYDKVNDHITIESEITIQEDELAHPLIAQILAIIGYEKTDCGYFYNTEPKASKSDRSTTIVSIKKPYSYAYSHEVRIKLRTLLDPEQAARYVATLRARRDAKK